MNALNRFWKWLTNEEVSNQVTTLRQVHTSPTTTTYREERVFKKDAPSIKSTEHLRQITKPMSVRRPTTYAQTRPTVIHETRTIEEDNSGTDFSTGVMQGMILGEMMNDFSAPVPMYVDPAPVYDAPAYTPDTSYSAPSYDPGPSYDYSPTPDASSSYDFGSSSYDSGSSFDSGGFGDGSF